MSPIHRDDDFEEDDEVYDLPRSRRRGGNGLACPECGSHSLHNGPWPWYLGTVGAMLCRAMVCDGCGHEFDANKPSANFAKRKRNLALVINGVGLMGIIAVVGGMVLYTMWIMKVGIFGR